MDSNVRAGSSPAFSTKPQIFYLGLFYYKEMATVYILYSKGIDSYYIGSCKDLEKRLFQHKTAAFSKSFTNRTTDWELVFELSDLEYRQAREIEKHIKKMKK